jgi:hypothetical protein
MPKVTVRHLGAARRTLRALAAEEHPELTPEIRDALTLVRSTLLDIELRLDRESDRS